MVVFSQTPVTVDGTLLDGFAWGIETKTKAMAGSRSADIPMAGVDGVAASLNDDYEGSLLTLGMWLRGTDQNGIVPANTNAIAQCRRNLDDLLFLFSKKHALMDVREDIGDGTTRQAWCKIAADPVTPTIVPGGAARFTVGLTIPDAFWQDPAVSDWSQASVVSGNTYSVSTLDGTNAPIADGILLLTGPANNPVITDVTTSAYVKLNRTLAAGDAWRVNAGTWSTQYGGALTLGSADSSGSNGDPYTESGNGNARLLRMVPSVVSGVRSIRLKVSGAGFTSATGLSVRARRKFLQ
jgi:hypothetical protein